MKESDEISKGLTGASDPVTPLRALVEFALISLQVDPSRVPGNPGKSQKEGQEDQGTLERLRASP